MLANLAGWMQVGCGFVKVQVPYGAGLFHNPGVVVVHAVNVGPDLDFVGPDGGAHQGCRVIAAAALEVVHLAVGVAADIPLREEQFARGLHQGQQMLPDVGLVRFPLVVQLHEIQRRQQDHVHTLLLQVQFHQAARRHIM